MTTPKLLGQRKKEKGKRKKEFTTFCLLPFAFCLLPLLGAAEYRQEQGRAVLRLQAPTKAGRALVPLSGTLLTVRVEGRLPVHVAWVKPFTSSKSWKVRPVAGGGPRAASTSWQEQFYLEPFGKPGATLDLNVPKLRVREGNHAPRQVTWKPIPVRLTTTIRKATLEEMRPITGPEPVPPAGSWRWVFLWLELALLVGVVGLLGWEVVRRRVYRPTVLTPADWALRELERLGRLDLSAGGAVERFPTLVTDVVRRYLELRFHLRAPRQTTVEFLAAMQSASQLAPAQQARLRDFLERCDLAKFARLMLSAEECKALAEQARGFVEQTASAVEEETTGDRGCPDSGGT